MNPDYILGIHNRPMPWDASMLVSVVPLMFGGARITLSRVGLQPESSIEDSW